MSRGSSQWRGAQVLALVLGCAFIVAVATGRAQQQPVPAPEIDMVEKAAKARSLAHVYADRLRTELGKALKEGGPVGAIGACNTIAPDLNASVTDELTFEVSRTAFRLRNPDNAADGWELAALELFQKAMAAGADPKTLETYDVVTTKEGQKLFRYMRPITMHEPCLLCHGPNVAQDVKSEIAKYYPEDKALGFNLGELRGAFSLVQQLD